MELQELNKKIQEYQTLTKQLKLQETQLRAYKSEAEKIKQTIFGALKEAGSDSWKSSTATVVIAKRKTTKIVDEGKLIKSLQKDPGFAKDYLSLRPNELFLNALKANSEWKLDGLTVQETEYLAIRDRKEKQNG